MEDGEEIGTRYCHVKRLTEGDSFYHHHVHLDARNELCPAGIRFLEEVGFSRSHISINCFTFAQMASPNSALCEAMFESSRPETWTLKTDCSKQMRAAFLRAREVMKGFEVEGYLESESVHSDRPIVGASKPFNRELFDSLCPRTTASDGSTSTFLDAEGQRRYLPFVVNMRNLDIQRGERAPVMEFHLSINYGMLNDLNLACLLHGMGLVSYEVPKICARADGQVILDPEGAPIIIRERPLTIRLANPGFSQSSRREWSKSLREFLGVSLYFRNLIKALGGFAEPVSFSEGELLYPVTFKLESLSGFYFQLQEESHLPPVFDFISPGTSNSLPQVSPSLPIIRDYLEGSWDCQRREI